MSQPREMKESEDEAVLRVFGTSKGELKERIKAVKGAGLPSAPAPEDEYELPTEAELAVTEKLKEVYAEVFAKREAEGTLWPAFFGEYALTRIVRGNAGKFDKICEWFSSFVKATDELEDFDGIIRRNTEALERAEQEGRRVQESDFSHYEELNQKYGCYAGGVFSCPRLSPVGDPIGYMCLRTHIRKKEVWEGENDAYKKFVEHWLEGALCNPMEVDKMTRETGRMVRKAWIFDAHQTGLSFIHKQFDDKFREDVNQYEKRCVAESIGCIFAPNMPGWLVKIANFFLRQSARLGFVDRRTLDRTFMLPDGGTSNPVLLRFVGAEQIAFLYSQRPKASEEDMDAALSGKTVVAAGCSFDRMIVVEPGQKVSWKFEVEQGKRLLGTADLIFSVVLVTDPPEGDATADMKEDSLKEPESISCDMGECTGELTMETGGVLRLSWSNEHSKIRSKGLTYAVEQGSA